MALFISTDFSTISSNPAKVPLLLIKSSKHTERERGTRDRDRYLALAGDEVAACGVDSGSRKFDGVDRKTN
jgi:hypothetical protein